MELAVGLDHHCVSISRYSVLFCLSFEIRIVYKLGKIVWVYKSNFFFFFEFAFSAYFSIYKQRKHRQLNDHFAITVPHQWYLIVDLDPGEFAEIKCMLVWC